MYLPEIRNEVQQVLMDETSQRWAPEALDIYIRQALSAIAEGIPYIVKETVSPDGGGEERGSASPASPT